MTCAGVGVEIVFSSLRLLVPQNQKKIPLHVRREKGSKISFLDT